MPTSVLIDYAHGWVVPPSPPVPPPPLVATRVTLASNGLFVKDLAFKLARMSGYQLVGDRLKRVKFFPAGTNDSGLTIGYGQVDEVELSPEDVDVANVIRVQGGDGTAIFAEVTNQVGYTTVTNAARKKIKVMVPKRKIKQVEIWTDPRRTNSGETLTVRVQADANGIPSDEADPRRDIVRHTLTADFLANAGFTMFLLPEHILGAGNEYWIIVESSGIFGQDVGVDGPGVLILRSHYAYPIIELVESAASIESFGRYEVDIPDPSIRTKQEARERALAELARRAFPERNLKFRIRDPALLSLLPGQKVRIAFPDEGLVAAPFIVYEREIVIQDTLLEASLTLIEEENLIGITDVIKNILERLTKMERVQSDPTGEGIVDIFNSFASEMDHQDSAVLSVDTSPAMIWGTDKWGLSTWGS